MRRDLVDWRRRGIGGGCWHGNQEMEKLIAKPIAAVDDDGGNGDHGDDEFALYFWASGQRVPETNACIMIWQSTRGHTLTQTSSCKHTNRHLAARV